MKTNSRKEKIQFLKGVLNGENKITDLLPIKWETFSNSEKEPDKYYRRGSTTEFYSRVGLNEYCKKNPNKHVIIIDIITRKSQLVEKENNDIYDLSLKFDRPQFEK